MKDVDDLPNLSVDTEMQEKKLELRLIQSSGRVDVPDDWLRELGLQEGDKIHLVIDPDDGTITIKPVDADNIL